MGLQLATTDDHNWIHATDPKGHKYRVTWKWVETLRESHSSWVFKKPYDFDFLVAVFLSHSWEILGIVKVPRAVVQKASTQTIYGHTFEFDRSIAEHPRVELVVWKDPFSLSWAEFEKPNPDL